MLSAATYESAQSFFDDLREREFGRLDAAGLSYLDYAGSALYGASQIAAHHRLLREGVFGNPHSEHGPSRASTEIVDDARRLLLAFLDVDESTHDVCFTANTTAAVKLVAEGYPFGQGTPLVLAVDNHNSVNGMREYARRGGARVRYLPLDDDLRLLDPAAVLAEEAVHGGGGLLAFPAQSNFSGVRHPLALVQHARAVGFDVLVDVAAFAPNHPFSLRACPADFAALSFYKLFGYPTGLGALVARRDALVRLRRPWFSGGTVTYAGVRALTHRLRTGHEGFEDGTPDFLGIAALPAGFALLDEVGMPRLQAHVARLTSMFLGNVMALRHGNGLPIARIHGPSTMKDRGCAVAFDVRDRAGRYIPYSAVETRAQRAGVAVRGGCFCNPGAAETAFGLEADRMSKCLDRLGPDFTVERFAACAGTAVGAVRVSVGLANNAADIDRALDVVASFRQ